MPNTESDNFKIVICGRGRILKGVEMNKIISSKSSLVTSFILIIFFGCFSLFMLGLMVSGVIPPKGMGLLIFAFFAGLTCFSLWYLNRNVCIIWVEDGVVKSKGFIRGFYKECPVRSIKCVKIVHLSFLEEGTFEAGYFIYLVSDRKEEYKKFLRLRKDSYIVFRKTKKNIAFLRTFWTGTLDKASSISIC